MIFSCVFGFSINVFTYLLLAYEEIGKSAVVLKIIFVLFNITWLVLLKKTKYHLVSVSIIVVSFICSLNIFRRKYAIIELFLGDKYDEIFDFFQNVNPIYYSGIIYVEIVVIVFLELIVIHTIVNKIPKEIKSENHYKVSMVKFNGLKEAFHIQICDNVQIFFYCEIKVISGKVRIEINGKHCQYATDFFCEDGDFEITLSKDDYTFKIISKEYKGVVDIDWHKVE